MRRHDNLKERSARVGHPGMRVADRDREKLDEASSTVRKGTPDCSVFAQLSGSPPVMAGAQGRISNGVHSLRVLNPVGCSAPKGSLRSV